MASADVHRRSIHEGTTLVDLRVALPPEVFVRRPWRAWFALVRSYALIALGEATAVAVPLERSASLVWRAPLCAAACLVVASGMGGLFVVGHDCGHRAFARRRWVNDLVGTLAMAPILTSFHAWRIGHNHHHARTMLRGDDTDWPERMLTRAEYASASWVDRVATRLVFGSPIGLSLGFVACLGRRALMPWLYRQVRLTKRARLQIARSNAITLMVSGGIGLAVAVAFGPVAMLRLYVAPLYLGMVLGGLFTYLHHSAEGQVVYDATSWTSFRGQVVSTFDVRFPGWVESLFLNINRHLPHHVAPEIPFYHLPAATDALVDAFPAYHQTAPFSLRLLARSWRTPVLEPIGEGVYVASTVKTRDDHS